jgi:hypothetical protein
MEDGKLVSEQLYSNQTELFEVIDHITSQKGFTFIKKMETILNMSSHHIFFNSPWFTFELRPYNLPDWNTNSLQYIYSKLEKSDWNAYYKNCIGILTFTETLKDDLSVFWGSFVKNIIHPLPFSRKKWVPEKYLNSVTRRIIQPGQDYRCINAIFMLPQSNFEKILLATCNFEELNSMLALERTNLGNEFRQPMTTTATLTFGTIHTIENWYDDSIFFLHLFDSSIDWIVLKCIADHVPLLINRLPSVLEYLGNDYPLFYNNYEEAIEKASNIELVILTHEYLQKRSKESFFSLTFFMNNLSQKLNAHLLQ